MSSVLSTALTVDASGEMVVLGAGATVVSVCSQSLPDATWTGWGGLALAPAGTTLGPGIAVAATPGGTLIGASIGSDGALWVIESTASGWPAGWRAVGRPDPTSLHGACGVTVTDGGDTVVVATGADRGLWSLTRSKNASWSGAEWVDAGAPSGTSLGFGCDVCCLSSQSLVAVAVGNTGQLYALTGGAAGWNDWESVGRPGATTVSGPVGVGCSSSAPATVCVVGTDHVAYLVNRGGSGWGAFRPLPQPAAPLKRLVADGTVNLGVSADYSGRIDVVAPAEDGSAYWIEPSDTSPAWATLDHPGDLLPLRQITGSGKADYVASVIASSASAAAVTPSAARTVVPLDKLRLGRVVTGSSSVVNVPLGAPFALAAVHDSTGALVSDGVGVTIVRPDGTTVGPETSPGAPREVIGRNGAGVNYFMIKAPADGDWRVTVNQADAAVDDFVVTFTTLPFFDVSASIAATLTTMCHQERLADPELNWGCVSCKFGVYIGAAAIAAVIVAGIVLTDGAAVVVWLSEFAGVESAVVLEFITTLADDGVKGVPTIVNRICKWMEACA